MARGLDHIVVAVRDLAAAAKGWENLGFIVTPENHHPWGTSNRLVQLDGFFIELLAVSQPDLIEEAGAGAFSFGAFNRDVLAGREGASMLVAESVSPEEDREDFDALGLATYEPFSFERVATFQDGSTGRVAFDLTFLTDPLLPGLAFFTCRNRYPETFWKAEFQAHSNGAVCLKAVYFVAEDPSDHHEFLGGFTGQREMRATSLGLEIATPRGVISVLNPPAYRHIAGERAFAALSGMRPQIAAIEITCRGLEKQQVIPASSATGCLTIILSPLN